MSELELVGANLVFDKAQVRANPVSWCCRLVSPRSKKPLSVDTLELSHHTVIHVPRDAHLGERLLRPEPQCDVAQ